MNLKKLLEMKNKLADEVNEMCSVTDKEQRALNADELEKVNAKLAEIRAIEESIKVEEERRSIERAPENGGEQARVDEKEKFEIEKRAFGELIRKDVLSYHEERADVNMTTGDNGAIIPATIANRIIETVKDICPIFQLSTIYNVGGTLSFPVYTEATGAKIECAYKDEFAELESTSGKFTTIELKNFLAGVLTKVSLSLVNNSAFDVAGYVITKVAQAVAEFMEQELLLGTAKMKGLVTSTNVVTTAAVAITTDEIIDLQGAVKKRFRGQGRFIMNPKTLTALRKLKDVDGKYLLNPDIRAGFGYTLLGSPVEESDAMPAMEAGKMAIAFGDFSGLYVKLSESLELQVLREKYATQHAIGVVGWIEADSAIVEPQKIAILKMKA